MKLTLQAGRTICKDGIPFVTINKCEGTHPVEADSFAKLIVAMHTALTTVQGAMEQIETDCQS